MPSGKAHDADASSASIANFGKMASLGEGGMRPAGPSRMTLVDATVRVFQLMIKIYFRIFSATTKSITITGYCAKACSQSIGHTAAATHCTGSSHHTATSKGIRWKQQHGSAHFLVTWTWTGQGTRKCTSTVSATATIRATGTECDEA